MPTMPLKTPDVVAAIVDWHDARMRALNAPNRTQYMEASADLWECEQRLTAVALQLKAEAEA